MITGKQEIALFIVAVLLAIIATIKFGNSDAFLWIASP